MRAPASISSHIGEHVFAGIEKRAMPREARELHEVTAAAPGSPARALILAPGVSRLAGLCGRPMDCTMCRPSVKKSSTHTRTCVDKVPVLVYSFLFEYCASVDTSIGMYQL